MEQCGENIIKPAFKNLDLRLCERNGSQPVIIDNRCGKFILRRLAAVLGQVRHIITQIRWHVVLVLICVLVGCLAGLVMVRIIQKQ